MKISPEGAGKRYGRHWIFRNCTDTFSAGESVALLGANGSGKSTLLRCIAGMQTLSTGKISYEKPDGTKIAADAVFQYLSFCAPGMELPEEMTLREVLAFHFIFKKPLPGFGVQEVIAETGLAAFADQQIGEYSSGMRQRVKLAQAIFSSTPLLLLDEPCTNLDDAGVMQYQRWISTYGKNRLIIVASNDEREYAFCERKISLGELI